MQTIAVVDYGMGNLRSVAKAAEHVAPDSRIVVTADPAAVLAARLLALELRGQVRAEPGLCWRPI